MAGSGPQRHHAAPDTGRARAAWLRRCNPLHPFPAGRSRRSRTPRPDHHCLDPHRRDPRPRAPPRPAGLGDHAAAHQDTSQTVSSTVRQDRPLFGAHRIRFGKIGSGTRISGLIRKAASTGASAICINQCAGLADRLDLGGTDITAQLRHVSASVNTLVTYRTDEENHGRLDQWSTPNETLARASGDCEDYAILKMAVLARLGVPVNAMEIVVVKDTSRRLFHAVLSVTLEDRTLILDNMTDAVETDTAKRSYAPLFSLSGSANYVFGYKGGKQDLTASLTNIASIAPGAGF
jgi:predicted transglutaminase-like cysteine proteinase